MNHLATDDEFNDDLSQIFEGRECQFGEGPRKLLRQFHDLAVKRGQAGTRLKPGERVSSFASLRVGDVFQNDYLRYNNRARKVVQIISDDEIETELVSTQSGRTVRSEVYDRNMYRSYEPYTIIDDPTSP